MKFRKNLVVADRIVRLTVSAIVIILFLLELIGGPLAAVLVSLSAVLTITALVGFCPIYRVLGVDNRNASSSDES